MEDDANRLPPELMRRYEVVVRPRQKHKAIKLRDVSAAHIGKLVRVQARPLPRAMLLLQSLTCLALKILSPLRCNHSAMLLTFSILLSLGNGWPSHRRSP